MRLSPHLPVLLSEAVDALSVREDGIYVDCTFGRGGHSRALLDRLGSKGRLVALDKDRDAVESTEARALSSDSHFTLIHTGFVRLAEQLERLGLLGRVDGILMDLGVSSPQLDTAERGFSFMRDGPLDMRMDVGAGLSAAEWLARVRRGSWRTCCGFTAKSVSPAVFPALLWNSGRNRPLLRRASWRD